MSWKDYITGIVPTWLTKPAAQGFLTSIGEVGDQLEQDAIDAGNYALLEECPNDGLNPHLRNSNLPVVVGEAPAVTRAYLRRRWETWEDSGGVASIVDGIARLGIPGAQVVTQLDLFLLGNVNAFGGTQGYFAVILPFPNPFAEGFLWRTDNVEWRDDQRLWGLGPSNALQLLGDVQALIRKFKSGPSSCRFIVVGLDNTFQWAIPKWNQATWNQFRWGANLVGRYRVIPMWEPWEVDPHTGAALEFYNYSWDKERA